MNASLDLKDIHLPDAISAWPPAPGWWMLLLLTMVLLTLATLLFLRWRRSPVTAALKELASLSKQDADDRQLLVKCSALLRRAAIQLYPGSPVASMSGDEWRQLMMEKGSLSSEQANYFCGLQYQPAVVIDRKDLVKVTRRWLKKHRRLGLSLPINVREGQHV